ncbi:MAG: hypothetical protein R3C42_07175 [Parvularculaceae bacterium]
MKSVIATAACRDKSRSALLNRPTTMPIAAPIRPTISAASPL